MSLIRNWDRHGTFPKLLCHPTQLPLLLRKKVACRIQEPREEASDPRSLASLSRVNKSKKIFII